MLGNSTKFYSKAGSVLFPFGISQHAPSLRRRFLRVFQTRLSLKYLQCISAYPVIGFDFKDKI